MLLLIILLTIIFFSKTNRSIINKRTVPNVPEYTNIYHLTPSQSTTLSTNNNNITNYLLKYPSNMNQKPWFKSWTNESNHLLCYLDKHLNRKCIWTCPKQCA